MSLLLASLILRTVIKPLSMLLAGFLLVVWTQGAIPEFPVLLDERIATIGDPLVSDWRLIGDDTVILLGYGQALYRLSTGEHLYGDLTDRAYYDLLDYWEAKDWLLLRNDDNSVSVIELAKNRTISRSAPYPGPIVQGGFWDEAESYFISDGNGVKLSNSIEGEPELLWEKLSYDDAWIIWPSDNEYLYFGIPGGRNYRRDARYLHPPYRRPWGPELVILDRRTRQQKRLLSSQFGIGFIQDNGHLLGSLSESRTIYPPINYYAFDLQTGSRISGSVPGRDIGPIAVSIDHSGEFIGMVLEPYDHDLDDQTYEIYRYEEYIHENINGIRKLTRLVLHAELTEQLDVIGSRVRSIDFSTEPYRLLTMHENGEIHHWDVKESTYLGKRHHLPKGVPFQLSPDERYFVAEVEGGIQIYDTVEDHSTDTFPSMGLWERYRFSADSETFYYLGADNVWRGISCQDGELLAILPGQTGLVTEVVVMRDGSSVAARFADGAVRVYNPHTLENTGTPINSADEFRISGIDPSGFLYEGDSERFRVYDLDSLGIVLEVVGASGAPDIYPLFSDTGDRICFKRRSSGETLIKVYDTVAKAYVLDVAIPEVVADDLRLSGDGKTVVVGDFSFEGETLYIYDIDGTGLPSILEIARHDVQGSLLSYDGTTLYRFVRYKGNFIIKAYIIQAGGVNWNTHVPFNRDEISNGSLQFFFNGDQVVLGSRTNGEFYFMDGRTGALSPAVSQPTDDLGDRFSWGTISFLDENAYLCFKGTGGLQLRRRSLGYPVASRLTLNNGRLICEIESSPGNHYRIMQGNLPNDLAIDSFSVEPVEGVAEIELSPPKKGSVFVRAIEVPVNE